MGPALDDLEAALGPWPGGPGAGERKLRLFDDRLLSLLGLALERLAQPLVAERARLC